MDDRERGTIEGVFVADSLALGPHWIYDPEEIRSRFGRVEQLLPPVEDSYHGGKRRGDLTHYGDQALVVLESVAVCGGLDLEDLARRWRELFAFGGLYVDKASRHVLESLAAGHAPTESGSPSTELGGAARIAPLVVTEHGDPDHMMADVDAQTAFTHASRQTRETAAFLARVVTAVLNGEAPATALEGVAAESPTFLLDLVREGLESRDEETTPALAHLGTSCYVGKQVPSVAHLVARYADEPREALIENVMAGGDSASRGMAVGMILGARHGAGAFPTAWREGLRARTRIDEAVAEL